MVEITIRVKSDNIIGIKEDAANYFEKFGDTQIVSVKEIRPEQTRIEK